MQPTFRVIPFAFLLICLPTLMISCKSVPKKAAASATAQELFQQGLAALHQGEPEQAAELFSQSLAQEDDPLRRREAAVQLVGAGRSDLALKTCESPGGSGDAAMIEAIQVFAAGPPPGQEKNPYVLPSMADAIELVGRNAGGEAAAVPVSFTPATLSAALRHWQRWASLSCSSSLPAEGEAAPAMRAMALWRMNQVPSEAQGSDFIIHAAAPGDSGTVILHRGDWPAGEEGAADEVMSIATPSAQGPAELRFGLWQGGHLAECLVLRGEFANGCFIVSEISSMAVLQGLLSVLADKDISTQRVRPRDDGEREQIIVLAEQLGLKDQLSQAGDALVVNLPADEDSPPPGQWLAEVAGYVRYGQAAMAEQPSNEAR